MSCLFSMGVVYMECVGGIPMVYMWCMYVLYVCFLVCVSYVFISVIRILCVCVHNECLVCVKKIKSFCTAIWMSSLEKCLFMFFCPFLHCIICFLGCGVW